MSKFLVFVTSLFFLTGCFYKDNLPKGVLPKEKMETVLWDVIKANAFVSTFVVKDSTKNFAIENAKMQLLVFELHKTTKEEFYKSYDYYTKNVDLIFPLIVNLTQKAQKEKISTPQVDRDTFLLRNKRHEKDIQ